MDRPWLCHSNGDRNYRLLPGCQYNSIIGIGIVCRQKMPERMLKNILSGILSIFYNDFLFIQLAHNS